MGRASSRGSRGGRREQEPAERVPLRNRIVDRVEMDPRELVKNPRNIRTHSDGQKSIMRSMLRTVGFVAPVMLNKTTGHLVDGHLRVEIAVEDEEPAIPVSVVELSQNEEDIVLAAYDPIAGLAGVDPVVQMRVLSEVNATGDVGRFLDEMLQEAAPLAAIAAAMSDEGSGEGEPRGWGLGKQTDLVKVVIAGSKLGVVEYALSATGLTNRGDALTQIAVSYLNAMGLPIPADLEAMMEVDS